MASGYCWLQVLAVKFSLTSEESTETVQTLEANKKRNVERLRISYQHFPGKHRELQMLLHNKGKVGQPSDTGGQKGFWQKTYPSQARARKISVWAALLGDESIGGFCPIRTKAYFFFVCLCFHWESIKKKMNFWRGTWRFNSPLLYTHIVASALTGVATEGSLVFCRSQ